jgi:SAM-dependent methyltransferase
MRPSVRELVRIAAETLPVEEPVVELGALQMPGQEDISDLRPLFPGRRYLGLDMRPGPGVDGRLDLHQLGLRDAAAGTVLILDTLEHVAYPQRAMAQVYRALRPGGLVVISSVMDHPIHDCPHDYWRFTPDGFRTLLDAFQSPFVGYSGRPLFPNTVVGLGCKGRQVDLAAFEARYLAWQHAWDTRHDRWWKRVLTPLTPPILLDMYRLARRAAR